MGKLEIVSSAAASESAIALTFDDGPSRWTSGILEELERVGARVTFFVVGRWVDDRPELLRDVVAAGHEIGNHTYTHRPLVDRPEAEIRDELERAGESIAKAIEAEPPTTMRPPVGLLDDRAVKVAAELGFKRIVLWSVSSIDYADTTSADDIVENVVPCTKPGSIVLFHDGPAPENQSHSCRPTVDALPRILDALGAGGYTFVTVSDLVDGRY